MTNEELKKLTLIPDYVKLKELAETIGPQTWTLGYNDARAILGPEDSDGDDLVIATVCDGSRSLNWHTNTHHCVPTRTHALKNAAYIAAANPSAILSLLKDLEEARAGWSAAQDEAAIQFTRAETAERERDEANVKANGWQDDWVSANAELNMLNGTLETLAVERDEANARAVVLGEALERATNELDEAAHRTRNVHTLLSRQLDECVSRGRRALTSLPASAKALVDCGGCKGVERLKNGECVRECSGDCFQAIANNIRALKSTTK